MSLKSGVHFVLNGISQLGLVIFQTLSRYVELVPTVRLKF